MSKRYRGSRGENQDYVRDLKKKVRSLERELKRVLKENLRLQPTQEDDDDEAKPVAVKPILLKCENKKCRYFDIPTETVTISTFDLLTGSKSYKVCTACGDRKPVVKK